MNYCPKIMLPTVYVLHSIAFLDLLAVSVVLPLISVHVRQMGGSHLVLGALGSVYAGFQLGSGPLIGSLSDIKGRKTVMIITLLFSSGAYLTIGLTNSIAVILLMRAVLGLFKQTQMLTRALVPVAEATSKTKNSTYSISFRVISLFLIQISLSECQSLLIDTIFSIKDIKIKENVF